MTINRQLLTVSRTVHVYLSLVLLLVLIFFAVTGITLNNAALLTASPDVTTTVLDELPELPRNADNQIVASPELDRFLRQQLGIRMRHALMSYEEQFLIVDYQTPGKATLVEIDQELNEAVVETTRFGLIAVLNDLHKGRHVDVVVSWLIDISGVILVLFSLAGLVLLLPNKRRLQKVVCYSGAVLIILGAGYYLTIY
jgi:hypothetical protein